MSESDVKTSETTSEKEIVIDLVDKDDGENEKNSEPVNDEPPKPKVAKKFVERKQIVDLTDDEKAFIVAYAKNGLDQPNFDVKFFKNGKYRILKKKETAPTVAQLISWAMRLRRWLTGGLLSSATKKPCAVPACFFGLRNAS